MRDPVLNEALKRLAAEASTRFSSLVATGDEIPFDVAEDSGESSLFYRYVPQTTRFVTAHVAELASLPSYGPTRGAVVTSDIAAPYLEARGVQVPSDPVRRAEEMLETFICGLWEGTTEFSLDIARLERALESLEVQARGAHEADTVLAPLLGFEMTGIEKTFQNGVRIVRSETVEAPLEATTSEGIERAAWEPSFLAVARLDGRSDGPQRALAQLHELVRAMRLYKAGCVSLGPYAFAPVDEHAWRRLNTGATGPRPGGYFLTEAEAEGLDRFMVAVTEGRPGAERVAWAAERFEYGCERARAADALSDHLLAIRSALSSEGLIGAPLAARAAALITGDGEDALARLRVERAFELEKAMIEGRSTYFPGESTGELAGWIEDGARTILREALLGRLGEDAGVAAEETLLTSGLQLGEGSPLEMGATAEWDAILPEAGSEIGGEHEIEIERTAEAEPSPEPQAEPERFDIFESEPEARRLFAADPDPEVTLETFSSYRTEPDPAPPEVPPPAPEASASDPGPDLSVPGFLSDDVPELFSAPERRDLEEDSGATRIMEPVPEPDEIKVTANKEVTADWLGSGSGGATLEWPSSAIGAEYRRRDERRHDLERTPSSDKSRARHLFPVPDNTDWSVGELKYRR